MTRHHGTRHHAYVAPRYKARGQARGSAAGTWPLASASMVGSILAEFHKIRILERLPAYTGVVAEYKSCDVN